MFLVSQPTLLLDTKSLREIIALLLLSSGSEQDIY